jgi:hypothetical protein
MKDLVDACTLSGQAGVDFKRCRRPLRGKRWRHRNLSGRALLCRGLAESCSPYLDRTRDGFFVRAALRREKPLNTKTTDARPHLEKGSHMTAKVLFTGKTHTTNGHNGAAHSSDGFLDIKLPQPHPAAENLFGAAWSACYMGALELAANKRRVKLPPDSPNSFRKRFGPGFGRCADCVPHGRRWRSPRLAPAR